MRRLRVRRRPGSVRRPFCRARNSRSRTCSIWMLRNRARVRSAAASPCCWPRQRRGSPTPHQTPGMPAAPAAPHGSWSTVPTPLFQTAASTPARTTRPRTDTKTPSPSLLGPITLTAAATTTPAARGLRASSPPSSCVGPRPRTIRWTRCRSPTARASSNHRRRGSRPPATPGCCTRRR